MLVLGIDLETTGLSTKEDEIIELGAVVWETKTNKPVAMLNHLIKQPNKGQLSSTIIDITGITDEDLDNFGIDEQVAINEFIQLARKCQYIIAHNGNHFDKPFIDKAVTRHGLELDMPWIDSMLDVPFTCATKKLTYLAAEHNFLNPFSHRALFDVLTMLNVCSNYDWQDIVKRSESPTITVVANVTKENRNLAKSKGFRWDAPNVRWIKYMKQCDLDNSNFEFEYDTE
jgi:DNA polymerase-3 subunit epsilon